MSTEKYRPNGFSSARRRLLPFFSLLAAGSCDAQKSDMRDSKMDDSHRQLELKLAAIRLQQLQDVVRYRNDLPNYYRLTNGELFAIPSKYQQFWLGRERQIQSLEPPNRVPVQDHLNFQFFMPDFSGYTTENFSDQFSKERISVRVQIKSRAQWDADEDIRSKPDELMAVFTKPGYRLVDLDNPELRWSMTCYRSTGMDRQFLYCFGVRSNGNNLVWHAHDYIDPKQSPPYPQAYTNYHSNDIAGGLAISIHMNTHQMPYWQAIDDFLRARLRAWRISNSQLPKSMIEHIKGS